MHDELSLERLQSVWAQLQGRVAPTVLVRSHSLSQRLGVDLVLACETFQPTGSFKYRAAYNLLRQVAETDVVSASSGNFGQAVALAARQLGKRCTVVMPHTSSRVKIEAVRSYGAQVELVDTRTTPRLQRVRELLNAQPGSFYAPAFDDLRVVAGNSSLGREVLDAVPDLDLILAPVGGGGLISGLVAARDALGSPVRVLGAEPALGNDAARSLHSGQLIANEFEPDTIADGARTLSLGQVTWPIVQHGVEDIIEVADASIAEAMRLLFRSANLKAEPTGALALGALLEAQGRFRGQRVCCVVSGGNVDEDLYARVLRHEL